MYSALFFLATSSFFIEGSMAIHDALVARQGTLFSSLTIRIPP